MVLTPLDQPEDLINFECRICGKVLPRVRHYWVYDRWLHPTCHPNCADRWSAQRATGPRKVLDIPERFANFDPGRVNGEAARLCGAFSPESRVKTLAIVGTPHKGKSRLLWAQVDQFFGELGTGVPDCFNFETLMSDFDRNAVTRISQSRYCVVDDIGSVESYGQSRALLQAAIRSRVKAGRWTFLSIDSMSFDPELEFIFKDRALVVVIE